MRYKSAAILSAAALAATLTVAGATSASAAAPVDNLRITQVGYNANGADTWFNRNKEYVDVLAEADVDVKGLTVSDSWAKNHADDNPKKCNTFTVTSLPGVAEVDGKLILPAGHKVRVYNGAGTPAVSGSYHLVYANSKCGYHGHFYGNGGDTVWLTQGANEESFTYNFDNGYYVR
ncbi:hypothetical protein ABZ917_17230 [Nonomuraea wenchangensis]